MKSYRYNDLGGNGEDVVITLTESEVRSRFYDDWFNRMKKNHHESVLTFSDFLDDWMVVYWAWEVK